MATDYLFAQPNLTSGIDDALISTTNSVPMFPVMILVFVFVLVFIGGSNNEKRRKGFADYPFWAALSGLSTFMIALLMTMGDGMINLTTLGIVTAITILCGVWFLMSSQKGEI